MKYLFPRRWGQLNMKSVIRGLAAGPVEDGTIFDIEDAG
jgi:hypothetical protein